MGCDIHIWAEVRANPNEPWQLKPGTPEQIAKEEADWCDDDGSEEERQRDKRRAFMWAADIDTEGRNYWLYGILSRVRIADVPFSFVEDSYTGRGVPEDASPEFKAEVESWDVDGHTHSWLTLRELLEWPHWHAVAGTLNDHEDPVFKAVFQRWRERSQQMTAGEREIASRRFRENPDDPEYGWPRPPTKQMTCAQVSGKFYAEMIPMLVGLGDPDDVRIVFFYDN